MAQCSTPCFSEYSTAIEIPRQQRSGRVANLQGASGLARLLSSPKTLALRQLHPDQALHADNEKHEAREYGDERQNREDLQVQRGRCA